MEIDEETGDTDTRLSVTVTSCVTTGETTTDNVWPLVKCVAV